VLSGQASAGKTLSVMDTFLSVLECPPLYFLWFTYDDENVKPSTEILIFPGAGALDQES
jgi:hypothetical protein